MSFTAIVFCYFIQANPLLSAKYGISSPNSPPLPQPDDGLSQANSSFLCNHLATFLSQSAIVDRYLLSDNILSLPSEYSLFIDVFSNVGANSYYSRDIKDSSPHYSIISWFLDLLIPFILFLSVVSLCFFSDSRSLSLSNHSFFFTCVFISIMCFIPLGFPIDDIHFSPAQQSLHSKEFEFDLNDHFDLDPADSSVDIPDDNMRAALCRSIGSEDDCSPSEFDLAQITDFAGKNSSISDIEGSEYLISINSFDISNNEITSLEPISNLGQISKLYIQTTDLSADPMDITDSNAYLNYSNRFSSVYLFGNPNIFDISVFYKSMGMLSFALSNSSLSIYIPLCRFELDTPFWTYFSNIFPLHDPNFSKDEYILPNNCSLNSNIGNKPYNCYGSQCPSIVLNEVYNPLSGEKECASISKEGSNGECFTVHDEYLRSYLRSNCGVSAEANGVLSVASLRSTATCTSLSLSDVSSDLSLITTLQGLEYVQGLDSEVNNIGLTELHLDGY
ncbi:hypothetical protein ADUPG1_006591, partial [Aduncisulcus paluster]